MAIAPITVERLRQDDHASYSAWLSSLDRGLVYASLPFGEFLSGATGAEIHHLVARRGDHIAGVLPFAALQAPDHGWAINSLPWYGSHGGCWLDRMDDHDARSALLQAYGDEIVDRDAMFATTVLSPWEETFVQRYSHALKQAVVDHRIGQILTLPEDADELEGALSATLRQKTRNLVRKACRQGFEEIVGDHDESWTYLYDTHQENMRAVGGKPKPLSQFEALRRIFSGYGGRLSVAYLNGEPVAGLFLLQFARTVEYLIPVVTSQHRPRQPLSFLIWRAMLDCTRNGFRYWNWGGTWLTQTSLHHFKAGWGGQDYPYSYLVAASPPALSRFGRNPEATMTDFPFFYLYPLNRIREEHNA